MNEIEKLAKEMMQSHGLLNWRFAWNNTRASFGKCKHGSRMIELSRILSPLRPMDEVKNTILHEIAHALVGGGHGHDMAWRYKFVSIGGNGKRCSSTANIDMEQVKTSGINYAGTCVNGHTVVRYRMPKRESSCAICSSRFDRRYILHFERQA
jgi:predicted SprT family Zn-dependent metalloprotease